MAEGPRGPRRPSSDGGAGSPPRTDPRAGLTHLGQAAGGLWERREGRPSPACGALIGTEGRVTPLASWGATGRGSLVQPVGLGVASDWRPCQILGKLVALRP